MKKRAQFNRLTCKLFESAGWVCDVTEHYNAFAGKTNDLFGFSDLLAACPRTKSTVAIQTTSSDHKADRKKKILASVKALLWLRAGNQIWIVHWKKIDLKYLDKRGASRTKKSWQPSIEFVELREFSNVISLAADNYKEAMEVHHKDLPANVLQFNPPHLREVK